MTKVGGKSYEGIFGNHEEFVPIGQLSSLNRDKPELILKD